MGIIIGSCVPEPEEPPRQTVFRGPVYGKIILKILFTTIGPCLYLLYNLNK